MLYISISSITLFGLFQTFTSEPIILKTPQDTSRVVNGYQVDITDLPYQATIRRRVSTSSWAHYCGAVIIHEHAVVTAAHCVIDYISEPSNIQVNVGTSYKLSGGRSYPVSKVISHEEYSPYTLENDIGLLLTSYDIKFNDGVQPIRVASNEMKIYDGMVALVSGFGSIEYGSLGSPVLLAAEVNIVSQEDCSKSYVRIANVAPGMLCAAAENPARDACQGDSGGPLVADDKLIGLVSWGEGCANISYPGVYTRVPEYFDWLKEKVLKFD